ncbi:MAG: hypothetical protein F4Z31_01570 [Gemmatimonadetes bacterium]|nr:hypothetical protein [Gemmatimonadota bacterium]
MSTTAPARAGGERPVDTKADVVASDTGVRPPSCEPGQRWTCPCGGIRPYVLAYCLACYHEDGGYHLSAAVALHNYADVVAGTQMGATHSEWGAKDPDAQAVGEADTIAWGLVIDTLDSTDKTDLNNAIEKIVVGSAIRVLGIAGVRRDIEMILRDLADSRHLAHNSCRHDHNLESGTTCPRSAT